MGLDTVEIVLDWEYFFGIEITDGEASNLYTVGQTIDLIARKVGARDEPSVCPTQRAFHRFRSSIRQALGTPGQKLHPRNRLRDLANRNSRREFWSHFEQASGLTRPSQGCRTIGEAVEELARSHFYQLHLSTELWTRRQVRHFVHQFVRYHTSAKSISDSDRFIEDLGLD